MIIFCHSEANGSRRNLQTCHGIVAAYFSLVYYSGMDINVPLAHCNTRNIYLILGAFVVLEALFSLHPTESLKSIQKGFKKRFQCIYNHFSCRADMLLSDQCQYSLNSDVNKAPVHADNICWQGRIRNRVSSMSILSCFPYLSVNV